MLTAFKVKDNRGYGEKERRAGKRRGERGQGSKDKRQGTRNKSGLEDIVL